MRWAASLVELGTQRNPDSLLIYVADRESDICEVFVRCRDAEVSFVIRAVHARAVVKTDTDTDAEVAAWTSADLMSSSAAAPVRGYVDLDIPRQKRRAKLEIRSTTVELRGPPRPGGRPANVMMKIGEVAHSW